MPLACEEADLTLSSQRCFVKEPSEVLSASPCRLLFPFMESDVFMLSLPLSTPQETQKSKMHHSHNKLGQGRFTVYSFG